MDFIIDSTGTKRYLGNNPSLLMASWPVYGETPDTPVFDKDQWKARVDALPGGTGPEWPYLSPVHDQDGVGQCNADATTSAMESCQLKMALPPVLLSSGDLYHRINGGRDRGSLLEDGLLESMKGIASVEDCGGNIWKQGKWRLGTPENRAKYRVTEAFLCPTFKHIFSAGLAGFDIISGVWWYDDAFNPDRDGWMPDRGRGNRGGHAVHGYKPTYRGNDYGMWHKNSWTPNWGLNGLAVFPEAFYAQGGVGGWWAVRSIVFYG